MVPVSKDKNGYKVIRRTGGRKRKATGRLILASSACRCKGKTFNTDNRRKDATPLGSIIFDERYDFNVEWKLSAIFTQS